MSTQTVSRVINERPDVSQETRKRVQEVIGRWGYQPSALARSLIRQRSYTLGVVTAGLKYIGPSRTLSGIAVVGAFMIGVLNNGMSIVGLGIDWQKVVKGVVLLIAVLFDVYNKNKSV